MSFDLGVWYSDAPTSVEQARHYYAHINRDWIDLSRRPEFDEFLTMLRARFPDPRGPDARPADPDEPRGALLMSVGELMSRVKSEPPPPPLTPEQMDEWRRTSPKLQAEMEDSSLALNLRRRRSPFTIAEHDAEADVARQSAAGRHAAARRGGVRAGTTRRGRITRAHLTLIGPKSTVHRHGRFRFLCTRTDSRSAATPP